MPIKLNGATSGSIELAVPAAVTGGDVNLTVPGAGTLDRLERAGNILQVVQGSTNTPVNIATAVYTDSGLSASITPTSSTSKILVIISQQVQYARGDTGQGVAIRILRDSTVIHAPTENAQGGLTNYIAAGGSTSINHYFVYNRTLLDSPNTTNAVTYKTQGRPYLDSNTGRCNFQYPNSVNNGTSYIQLIEVAV